MQAYKFYKSVEVAESGEAYLEKIEHKNPSGVIYAKENADFDKQFVDAIAQRRFWDRK